MGVPADMNSAQLDHDTPRNPKNKTVSPGANSNSNIKIRAKVPILKNLGTRKMDLNQAVITTKYVIEFKSKVVYVYHSRDGWQFYGAEKNIEKSDSRIVSLKKILLSNPHVEKILWIPEDMEAWINNGKDDWLTGVSS